MPHCGVWGPQDSATGYTGVGQLPKATWREDMKRDLLGGNVEGPPATLPGRGQAGGQGETKLGWA